MFQRVGVNEKAFKAPTLREVWSFESEETLGIVVGSILIFASGATSGPLTLVDLKTQAVVRR